MKKLTFIVCTFLTAIGLFGVITFVNPSTTQAADEYVDLITKHYHNLPYKWNGNRHAYLWDDTITKREHRLANYPKKIWYVSAAQIMTNGHKTGIFYYVSDKSGNFVGYIWSGYLVPDRASKAWKGVANPTPPKATGEYAILDSKNYYNLPYKWNGNRHAYLWNDTITKRKHRLINYPKKVWYVDEALKMTNGRKTGIFYSVFDKGDRHSGYVWSGYLVPDKASKDWTGFTNPAGIPHASKEELKEAKRLFNDTDAFDSTVEWYQDHTISKLFPGTTQQNRLDDAAEYKNFNYRNSIANEEFGDKFKDIQYIKLSVKPTHQQIQDLATGKLTLKAFVLADLKKQKVNLNGYHGWQIGAYSVSIYKTASKKYYYPKFGQYTFAFLAPQYQ